MIKPITHKTEWVDDLDGTAIDIDDTNQADILLHVGADDGGWRCVLFDEDGFAAWVEGEILPRYERIKAKTRGAS